MERGEFTLKEISRQDVGLGIVRAQFEKFGRIIAEVNSQKYDKIIFLGCGTSYYLAATASVYFAKYNNVKTDYLASYEFSANIDCYVKPTEKVLIVPFTRVASTSETMNAVKKALSLGNVKSLQITCDDFSSTYSTWSLYIPDMFENSIVMTSSYTAMLYAAMYFAATSAKNEALIKELAALPEDCHKNMETFRSKAEKLAKKNKDADLFIGLGNGSFYGLAGESSIKVKEMTLIPSECYYSLEYRHGPISIAGKNTVIVYYVSANTSKDDVRLIEELKELKATVIAIGSVTDEIAKICDESFVSSLSERSCLPEMIVPMQYFGAYLAIEKGYNPDKPRNLSKAIILK